MSRPLVWSMSVSVDGYFEGPDADLSWHLVDEELHRHFNEVYGQAGAYVDGRVSFETMAAYWPTADQDPDAGPVEREFAAIWRRVPKIVYSSTLVEDRWDTTVLRRLDARELRSLKDQDGGFLALGGAALAGQVWDLGLVDELRLYVHPVVVAAGRRLFEAAGARRLDLLGTRTFGNGVVQQRYRVGAAIA